MIRGVPLSDHGVKFGRQGYTIVEVLIFLAITGLLFTMIALTFTGTRGRTQFQTAARDIESRARDVINDTSSGYYSRPADFGCEAGPTGPAFSSDAASQGTNQECIFIGRAVHFDVGDNANRYNIYTIAGLRLNSSDQEVSDFDEANPRAVITPVDITQRLNLPNAAEIASIYYIDGGIETFVNAVGFFSSFGRYADGALQPGALSVNMVPLGDGTTVSESSMTTAIEALGDNAVPASQNPDSGLVVCINSGTSDQHAVLKIGGDNSQLTTDLEILEGLVAEGATCD